MSINIFYLFFGIFIFYYIGFKMTKQSFLPKEYFEADTLKLAKDLIGKIFIKNESNGQTLSGIIVETEAYIPDGDLANHAHRGKTKRNAPMFEAGGIIYVYQIYGIHHCINIVSGSSGEGSAVLLRGIEPISGIETMKERRKTKIISQLCNGPGKIAQAFSINKQDNYKQLGNSEFLITDGIDIRDNDIVTTTRIGINLSKELPLRFYLKGNSSVSRL